MTINKEKWEALSDELKAVLDQALTQIEEAESVAFQEAYYYRLLHQASAHRKHPIRIEIQSSANPNRTARRNPSAASPNDP